MPGVIGRAFRGEFQMSHRSCTARPRTRLLAAALLLALPTAVLPAAAGSPGAAAHEVHAPAAGAPGAAVPAPAAGSPFAPAAGAAQRRTTEQPAARRAPQLPDRFRDTVVMSRLDEPTAIDFADDGRVFVAEKPGVVKVFDSLDDPTGEVFADLNATVMNYWDRGLLGMTLAPDFPEDPSVYVLYAYDHLPGDPAPAPRWGRPGAYYDECADPVGVGCTVGARVSRLTAEGDRMVGEEEVLVEDGCLQYPSHATGSVAFGPDGYLYASIGEGASFTFDDYGQGGGNPCRDPFDPDHPREAQGGSLRSQDIRTYGDPLGLDGTVVRLDPTTGLGAPDNALVDSGDANAARMVAHGLRNPFRFTFRPGTDEVWVGDVGGSRFEEINRIADPTAGVRNFGWPCYEGAERNPAFDVLDVRMCEDLYADAGTPLAAAEPFFRYATRGQHVAAGEACPTGSASVSGLDFVAQDSDYPAWLRGALVFSDYSRRCIWAMPAGADGLPDPDRVVPLVEGAASPIGLVTGPGGDLFYLDLGIDDLGYPTASGGAVHRISHHPGNQPPVADLRADRTWGPLPLTTVLDASGSTDADGDALTYAWDLDADGDYDDATGPRVEQTWSEARNAPVAVRVADAGAADRAALTLFPGDTPPEVTLAEPTADLRWSVGQQITVSASATDAEDGEVDPGAWQIGLSIKHCPSICHTHPVEVVSYTSTTTFTAPDHEYPSSLAITVAATDSRGLATTRELTLEPDPQRVRFGSNARGASLSVAGERVRAGQVRTFITGSTVTLAAPRVQRVDARRWVFRRWSDGSARVHALVVPDRGDRTPTLRALYRRARG
ncbi:PQQ-dependent sugar dehydrogenase [Nocardioides sp. Leaf374]|uniref:PQQ-dependent sugar dehydrogenase n=1 Tax=Nocardioides sp. Leaf374 TaxID=2876560 RepID=UPI001E50F7D4|nr:PQQ-dependent sugar dehydrogenase [Nocardioides sp. Leaf374]